MRRTGLILGVAFVAVIIGGFWYGSFTSAQPVAAAPLAQKIISIDGNTIHVTVVDNDTDRERGLGGRSGLAPDEGMLFVFQKDGLYRFWMKDMQFSIDMLWIDSNGKIIFIQPDVAPSTYPNSFGPHQLARYVLELPANYAAQHGVATGDLVNFKFTVLSKG
jgi:uncharacterized protein